MKRYVLRYLQILSSFGRNFGFHGVGGGAKFHDYKKVEILFFSCMVTIVVTNVCILEHSVDRNMHESCKNAQKMFKYLQYEIL